MRATREMFLGEGGRMIAASTHHDSLYGDPQIGLRSTNWTGTAFSIGAQHQMWGPGYIFGDCRFVHIVLINNMLLINIYYL